MSDLNSLRARHCRWVHAGLQRLPVSPGESVGLVWRMFRVEWVLRTGLNVCVLCYIQSIGNLGRVVGLSRFAPPHFDPEHCLSNPLNFWEKIIWGRQGIRGRPNDGRWCPMDGRFTGMTPNVVRDLVRIHASQVLYCLVVWLEIDPKISSSCTPSMHLQHDQCRSIQSHDILSGICMVG